MAGRQVFVLVSLLFVALVGGPAVARADDAKDQKKQAHKEAKEERKEDRKDAREAHKDLREAVRDAGRDSEAAKDARASLGEARQKLKESRHERRTAAKAALTAKWGDELLKKPAVRAELRLHALRMAKLHQMKRVADAADKKELEARVDKLTEKEKARHQTRMDTLKTKNGEDSK
jgi:hypothetical protein